MGTVSTIESVPGAGNAAARAWREPAALTLDQDGVIVDFSGRGEEFFGYSRSELARQHVSMLVPWLAGLDLFENGQPNAYFNFLCHIGHSFEVIPRRGVVFLCEFSIVWLKDAGQTLVRLIVQSPSGMAV